MIISVITVDGAGFTNDISVLAEPSEFRLLQGTCLLAIGLLSKRECFRNRLYAKLLSKFATLDLITLLDELVAVDLQSDVCYAGVFLRSKVDDGYERSRIKRWALQAGLSNDPIQHALAEYPKD